MTVDRCVSSGISFGHLALTFPVYSDQCKRKLLLTGPGLLCHVCVVVLAQLSLSILAVTLTCVRTEAVQWSQGDCIHFGGRLSMWCLIHSSVCVIPYLCASFRCYVRQQWGGLLTSRGEERWGWCPHYAQRLMWLYINSCGCMYRWVYVVVFLHHLFKYASRIISFPTHTAQCLHACLLEWLF